MPAIVLASRNRKKTQEVSEILAPLGFTVVSVTQFPLVPEVDEDGCTFAENAAKKAREVALHLKQWVIGEDSGLTVDALNGAPEFTRHATAIRGPPMNAIIRNCSRNSATYPTTNERAGYVCSVALADPTGQIRIACEGTCRGRILHHASGEGGFGYDPFFLVPEYHRSFGQLSAVVKHRISHRAKAFARFAPCWSRSAQNSERRSEWLAGPPARFVWSR
ncbi:MAG UNVERIFIED_CONTAM: non-canonical purine NTP pyrophosphatase [Planctomycetaceae bacterium]|jgi:XTP/dITP diphosphohydrolase